MEVYSSLYVIYLIPILLGISSGILYAMIFMKEEFHPQKLYNDKTGLSYLHFGWITYAIGGGIGGIIAGFLFSYFDFPHYAVFILSVISAFMYCWNLEGRRREEREG